jgi:hypothetical protein
LRLSEVGLQKVKYFASVSESSVVTAKDSTKLSFSTIINSPTSLEQQLELYHKLKPCMAGLFSGRNVLVFSLGSGCSGKSFCIQGTKEHPGLLPRTVEYLFDCIEK